MPFCSQQNLAAKSNLSNRRQIYSRGDFIPFKFISVSPASKAATLKFDAIKPEFSQIALNLPLKFS
ncbi:hypothetical protein [Campylobacter showae]|uniref:hypothetical protein n=1 Tax=Campylobacter showae TaxID=204 RepID=UPI0028D44820|nr:hypothetical protein [Campylobacter showae]